MSSIPKTRWRREIKRKHLSSFLYRNSKGSLTNDTWLYSKVGLLKHCSLRIFPPVRSSANNRDDKKSFISHEFALIMVGSGGVYDLIGRITYFISGLTASTSFPLIENTLPFDSISRIDSSCSWQRYTNPLFGFHFPHSEMVFKAGTGISKLITVK